jgi:hypothetical protein
MNDWLRYLIALVIGCHGFGYLMFAQHVPSGLKDWQGSMLLGAAIGGDAVRTLLAVLHIGAGAAAIACALAIAAAPWAPGWWRPLAIAGGLFGLAAFTVCIDGQAGLLAEEGGIGAAISLVLLSGAVAFPAAFA